MIYRLITGWSKHINIAKFKSWNQEIEQIYWVIYLLLLTDCLIWMYLGSFVGCTQYKSISYGESRKTRNYWRVVSSLCETPKECIFATPLRIDTMTWSRVERLTIGTAGMAFNGAISINSWCKLMITQYHRFALDLSGPRWSRRFPWTSGASLSKGQIS